MPKPTDAVYERMLLVWRVSDYIALAKKLKLKPSSLRQSKSEGKVPDNYVLRTMLETGCAEEWLLAGRGPKYRDDLFVNDLPEHLRRAVRLSLDLNGDLQAALEGLAEIFAAHDEETNGVFMYHIRGQLHALQTTGKKFQKGSPDLDARDEPLP